MLLLLLESIYSEWYLFVVNDYKDNMGVWLRPRQKNQETFEIQLI